MTAVDTAMLAAQLRDLARNLRGIGADSASALVGETAQVLVEIRADSLAAATNDDLLSELHRRQRIVESVAPPVGGPHSRACGPMKHDHGPACHPNCPTCGHR